MDFRRHIFYIYFSITVLLCVDPSKSMKAESSVDLHGVLSQKLSFEEEYNLFEEELDKGIAKHSQKSRQKRYVYFNTEANVDVGFLIVIPITVVLPGMTNLFNNWRRKRSVTNINMNATIEDNPLLQAQVDRISSYFELIDIPETSCQIRALCEFSADPNKYFPLSDILISKVKDQTTQPNPFIFQNNTYGKAPTLYNLYSDAVDNGAMFGMSQCKDKYNGACKYSMDKLLNMSVMKFWNKLQSKLGLRFDDVTEFSVL